MRRFAYFCTEKSHGMLVGWDTPSEFFILSLEYWIRVSQGWYYLDWVELIPIFANRSNRYTRVSRNLENLVRWCLFACFQRAVGPLLLSETLLCGRVLEWDRCSLDRYTRFISFWDIWKMNEMLSCTRSPKLPRVIYRSNRGETHLNRLLWCFWCWDEYLSVKTFFTAFFEPFFLDFQ